MAVRNINIFIIVQSKSNQGFTNFVFKREPSPLSLCNLVAEGGFAPPTLGL